MRNIKQTLSSKTDMSSLMINKTFLKHSLALAILATIHSVTYAEEKKNVQTEDTNNEIVKLDTIVVKAAKDELKQTAGLSVIGSETLSKQPVANDISEIVRKMPGVNLSGSSTSGQRGNQRQIDLRGMGPDNTLILIDGRPVTSRMAVRPGRAGEKDTRGDSQWVPPTSIERIEVLRGPAAARYGSGSMGGVVNIITKSPTEQEASITGYYELPENKLEGSSWRTGINLAGPLTDKLSYRTTLGFNKSEGDDADLNKDAAINGSVAAGSEGVENIDARQLFEYAFDAIHTIGIELNYSNQSNLWAGDSQNQIINANLVNNLAGEKTNEMERYGFSLIHRGDYGDAKSNSFIEYNITNNTRLEEGTGGSGEGQIIQGNIEAPSWIEAKFETINAKSEWDLFFNKHTLTLGAEFRGERLNNGAIDLVNAIPTNDGFGNLDLDPAERNPKSDGYLLGVYFEDNYQVTADWFITPGLRIDYHNKAGVNWSPSLNTTWQFSDNWSVKGGISRAFKAPNLYQIDPNYIYYTNGNGCPSWVDSQDRGCHVLGNESLDNEVSWNKELTFTYDDGTGLTAGLTYYRNDYENRVAAGEDRVGFLTDLNTQRKRSLFQWENQGEAIIEGVEAFIQVPVTDAIKWNTNFTGNVRSERKDTGEALSLIPKFTVNTSLDWAITDNWNANMIASYYDEIEAPKFSATNGNAIEEEKQLNREAYILVNLNTQYNVNKGLTLGMGIKNLFDEKVMREGTGNNAGARTFNEPGRAYTFNIKYNF